MRLLAAFLMLGLAFELTRWIRRRHQQDAANPSGRLEGKASSELPAGSGGGQIVKGEIVKIEDPEEPGRLLTTRGIETVAAMVAFVLIFVAIILVLRTIVRF